MTSNKNEATNNDSNTAYYKNDQRTIRKEQQSKCNELALDCKNNYSYNEVKSIHSTIDDCSEKSRDFESKLEESFEDTFKM